MRYGQTKVQHSKQAYAKQHIPREKKRAYCSVLLTVNHLIYYPKQHESLAAMRKKRVCLTCLMSSDKEYEYKD